MRSPFGQDHLEAAVRGLVDRVRHVGEPVLERVRDDASPADVDDGGDEVVAAGLDRVVQVEPAHAGLDDGVAELLVDLQDPVHVPERQHHRAAHLRRGTAVAVVLAAADGPQRDAVLVGDPNDRLDVLDARRADDAGRDVRGGAGDLEGILEVLQGLGIGGDLVLADRGGERRERPFEVDLGDAGRERAVASRGDAHHSSSPLMRCDVRDTCCHPAPSVRGRGETAGRMVQSVHRSVHGLHASRPLRRCRSASAVVAWAQS